MLLHQRRDPGHSADELFRAQYDRVRAAMEWCDSLPDVSESRVAAASPSRQGASPRRRSPAVDDPSPAQQPVEERLHCLRPARRTSSTGEDSCQVFIQTRASEDHGRDTMLLDSPGQLHHVRAHHAPNDGRLSPSSAQPPANMEGAPTALAIAIVADDAHGHGDGAPAAMAAPATEGVSAPPLAALADPIDFTQPIDVHANANATAMDMNTSMDMDMAMGAALAPLPTDINAFARLRFFDGSYYMHTYQLILGRNKELAKRDSRRLAKIQKLRDEGQEQAANALQAQMRTESASNKKRKQRPHRAARSVVSEKGGIVSAPIAAMPVEYQQRRQSNAEHSLSSASHHNGDSSDEQHASRVPQEVLMQAFSEAPTYMDGHVPEDPNDCPFVPIHPSHLEVGQGPKSISRTHARIFYDFQTEQFHVEVLGTNGLHHENEFYHPGEVIALEHGDELTIGGVTIHFYLPDNTLTEDQRQRRKSTSRPISYSFEDGNGELMVESDSDEQMGLESDANGSVNPRHVYIRGQPESDLESEDAVEDDDLDEYEEPVPRARPKPSIKLKLKSPPPSLPRKEVKKAPKRKQREATPDEPPQKKVKHQVKEPVKEPVREAKASKEPKEQKDKGKAPAKGPAKTPASQKTTEDAKTEPVQEAVEKSKPAPNDAPIVLRAPLEGEIEAGDVEGLLTDEIVREYKLPQALVGHIMEKRKGPGRPPKDGIMSKRQRSLLVKQGKEIEKARAAGIDPADIPAPAMKPKAPKRKESNAADGDEDDVMETTEKGDGTLLGDKKHTKPVKPPRTPSPEMRIEDYTEEQLQRPQLNYVVLIHEAISSSPSGQMNLQQIYNHIERKYPWYKFKTTTSGWQSSVRHNLGQHDAFVKGDKEGKGFNWRVNPEVSIEKERRKRQVSPPMNAPRQPYYPAPNGYPQYPQPGYPYHTGMPHAMPPAAPRLPPSLSQPRLPPSMARDTNAPTSTTPQSAPSHASPYASPWAGGNVAGSPPASNAPRPYPPSSQALPTGSAGSSGPHAYATSAPQTQNGLPTASPYSGQQYGATGAPHGPAPGQQPYAPYSPAQVPPLPYPAQPAQGHAPSERTTPHSSGRYPLATHPDLIRQLETFRSHYLSKRTEAGEDKKVDNAIRACVDTTVPIASLTQDERNLLEYIRKVEGITKHLELKQDSAPSNALVKGPIEAGTAAAIAAGAASGTSTGQMRTDSASGSVPSTQTPQPGHEPHKFTPNMTGATSYTSSSTAVSPSHRPSVEPLTPLPGSPATQIGMSLKIDGDEEAKKVDADDEKSMAG